MSTMISNFLNVSEAAEVIGCTDGRVRQMLRSGEMQGVKANEKAWLVDREEAERIAKVRRGAGRPRKFENHA